MNQHTTHPPTPTRSRWRRAGATATIGALAIAAMLAGGIALAAIVDRVTLGGELTVSGTTGLEVAAPQTSGGTTTYLVTVHEDLTAAFAAGWTMQVVDTGGSDDLAKYFDCTAAVTHADVGDGTGIDAAASSLSGHTGYDKTDCHAEIPLFLATNNPDDDYAAKSISITLARNTTKLIGTANTVTVTPELIVDDGT